MTMEEMTMAIASIYEALNPDYDGDEPHEADPRPVTDGQTSSSSAHSSWRSLPTEQADRKDSATSA